MDSFEVAEYRKSSLGSFRTNLQPKFLFSVPISVTFLGLELDITQLETLVVNKHNDRAAQADYVRMSGLLQSALEHVIPSLLLSNDQNPVEGISAIKALNLASEQGQRIFKVTSATIDQVLPQLQLSSDVIADLKAAVAAGKEVTVSEREITIGSWTGVGYLIIDPETGAGAYIHCTGQKK